MSNILNYNIVKTEMERIRSVKSADAVGRDVEGDIQILKEGLMKVNAIVNGTEDLAIMYIYI